MRERIERHGAPGADRLLRWVTVVLALGVGAHGIDHMVVRGMAASPAPVIVGGYIQAGFVLIAMAMVLTRRRRAPEAAAAAGFGSAALFVYAHALPSVWHGYSDSFVSPPHTGVSWYSWVTAVAEIGAGVVAGVAGVRASRNRGATAERPTVVVERTIAAPPEALYELVGEVSGMARWSPETVRCRWLPPATGPAVGARFRGTNRQGRRRWSTTCTVVAAEHGRRFGFEVRLGRRPFSRWLYTFEARGAGCRVAETWTDLRPAWMLPLSWVISGVTDRTGHNRAGMEATLAALALAAERSEAGRA
ncbi:SRPBCC family protein [Actinomadura rugatobispora]|uniref:SRPBCC family protein n=1 Tax=Actinomadura rugatobispora TaxID=1994 RepID=A0ABW1AAX7_9ACTN|nr:hypothetical protein GCM10010200_053620 [Actinomadura rugatobispora]